MSLIILIIVNILIILFIMVHNFDFLAKVLSKCHSPWNIGAMSRHIMDAMLPECEIFKKDLHEGACSIIFQSHFLAYMTFILVYDIQQEMVCKLFGSIG